MWSLNHWITREVLVVAVFLFVWFFSTPWTVAHQSALSTGFPRQEYWSGLPFPRGLPDPGVTPISPALAGRLFTAQPLGMSSPNVTTITGPLNHHVYLFPFSKGRQSCPDLPGPRQWACFVLLTGLHALWSLLFLLYLVSLNSVIWTRHWNFFLFLFPSPCWVALFKHLVAWSWLCQPHDHKAKPSYGAWPSIDLL